MSRIRAGVACRGGCLAVVVAAAAAFVMTKVVLVKTWRGQPLTKSDSAQHSFYKPSMTTLRGKDSKTACAEYLGDGVDKSVDLVKARSTRW